MKTKSALAYFGSDSEVAGQLAALLDGRKHVTIPFVGGAAILPHLKARAIVANDLNQHAITFYRVISGVCGVDEKTNLIDFCQATLSHPANLSLAREKLDSTAPSEKAWAYWALCWLGRKGNGGTKNMGGLPSVRRTPTGGTNATRVAAAADDLQAWAEHFKRCEWECRDFREQLEDVADNKDCGIYCDPPWIGAGDKYVHSFSQRDHRDLHFHLGRFEHTLVVVRYGDDPFIRELYKRWKIVEASSRTQVNTACKEIWLTNL